MAKFALIMPPKDFSLKDYFLNNLNTGEVLTSMTEAIRRRLREDSFSRRILAVEPPEPMPPSLYPYRVVDVNGAEIEMSRDAINIVSENEIRPELLPFRVIDANGEIIEADAGTVSLLAGQNRYSMGVDWSIRESVGVTILNSEAIAKMKFEPYPFPIAIFQTNI